MALSGAAFAGADLRAGAGAFFFMAIVIETFLSRALTSRTPYPHSVYGHYIWDTGCVPADSIGDKTPAGANANLSHCRNWKTSAGYAMRR